jgi:hypothetical protein
MASFEVIGIINTIKYLQNSVLLFVDEFRKGYRRSDGSREEDKYITWKIVFKPYFKKYLSEHFGDGMLVKVKGEVLPYVVERNQVADGYSVVGETCNLCSYPRASIKDEQRMIKDSLESISERPDLKTFSSPDF